MNTTIVVLDKKIYVRMVLHALVIHNNDDLIFLVTKMPASATDELVTAIKEAYKNNFNVDFGVSESSIAVEIWGHVYAEKFGDAVKAATSIKLLDELAEKIIYHSKEINIGEKGFDNNRFVWDALAKAKPAIEKILF